MKEPLSKKAKECILNLNIEEDVRMLRHKLKIGTTALDYFRSSSGLLQAGVKAGLSLYDIAHACCRSDDIGEVPSKLEILANQAAEIAMSAVESGKWHHSAASGDL